MEIGQSLYVVQCSCGREGSDSQAGQLELISRSSHTTVCAENYCTQNQFKIYLDKTAADVSEGMHNLWGAYAENLGQMFRKE